MKKTYNVLEIRVKIFACDDIIRTSGYQPTVVDDSDNFKSDIFF